jgi:AraC-like DNA-binding protein
MLALLAAGLLTGPPEADALGGARTAQKALAAGFVVAALWRLWASDAGDLVPSRRIVRHWLLAYIGMHGMVILAVELVLRGSRPPGWVDALNVAVIGIALSVSLALLVRFHAGAIETLFGTGEEAGGKSDTPTPAMPAGTAIDAQWVERLQRLMTADCAYRDPELSATALAQRLGLPEYRLRELINRQLGYRNFPAFVNDHRLREVEGKLVDPALDRYPILTLALEAGFGSIGPFNRAFRDRHGVTPTAFRSRRGSATPVT